jgi:hypothetical protein
MPQQDLLAAVNRGEETVSVEFKSSIDLTSPGEWLEIVKDIVALANSGGGALIFGVADDGQPSGFDCSLMKTLDPASLTDKIYKYTGQQFHQFEFVPFASGVNQLLAIRVSAAAWPLVFSKAGTYDAGGGKQKTAFSSGTVYFRHGAKSEPGNSDDLRLFVERRIEQIRKSWLDGIAKVVEAPAGSYIQVVPPGGAATITQGSVRLVDDPAAPALRSISVDITHPFRQKEVVEQVNIALKGAKVIKPFQIQCVRQAHHVEANATFCYKQKYASARYSQAFVDWVLQQYAAAANFFEAAKVQLDELKFR